MLVSEITHSYFYQVPILLLMRPLLDLLLMSGKCRAERRVYALCVRELTVYNYFRNVANFRLGLHDYVGENAKDCKFGSTIEQERVSISYHERA